MEREPEGAIPGADDASPVRRGTPANKREPDEREQAADEREAIADQRERAADERESHLDERARKLGTDSTATEASTPYSRKYSNQGAQPLACTTTDNIR
jgi:hypothetical protein